MMPSRPRPRPASRPRRHRLGGWAAAALLALPVALAAQVPSDAVLRDFAPTGSFLLEVDGKDVPKAEIYQSEAAAAILVITSALPAPVLVAPRTQSVEMINLMKVAKQKDGTVDLLADATLERQGRFTVDGDTVAFMVDGKRVRLKAKPPLLKLQTADSLKLHSPEYIFTGRAYTPDASTLAALKAQRQPVRVQVFFGSWCSYCKRYLPRLLRVEEQLAGSPIRFEYYGLPSGPALAEDPEAKKAGIHGVPTGVVYAGSREVGRIQNEDWSTPEKAILDLLAKSAS
jgi:thiol-disulfide isomerase/thioredoxin